MAATQAAPSAAQTQGQGLLAGGQANQQRPPFWNVGMQGGAPPMLAAGLPANFYPQMAAFAAAQENATAMIAVSKLGTSKMNPNTNSTLVLRSSVRKFNASGAPLSVAQWTRQTVEENLEWLVKLTKRHSEGHKAILLAYGDGCETLVLLDEQINKLPSDFNKLKKVCIGCSMTNADSTLDEGQLAKQGVLQPVDSLWEHLRFETLGASEKKVEKCLFIHTHISIYTGSMEGRRRVLQVKTGTGLSYQPNPLFEQQVLSAWAGQTVGATPTAVGVVAPAEDEEPENETVITFNPKELLLLEKAFDNRLTNRDLKAHSNKFTDEDRIAAQYVIKRAQAEFVMRGPPRKRRKKDETKPETEEKVEEKKEVTPEAPKEVKKAEKKPVKKESKKDEEKKAETPKAPPKAKAKTPAKTPKSTRKSKEADEDDDEPISKMVKKEKSPAKKGRRQSSGSTKDKEKTPKTVKKETKVAKPQESSKKRTRKSKK
eukprot:Nitzschia sp. Nitz4//scaffold64_size103689//34958//36412//NITZ4_004430-RA/size103689-processed-gene-0.75-mRNA-1//1//CDS//3329556112//1028//frame0